MSVKPEISVVPTRSATTTRATIGASASRATKRSTSRPAIPSVGTSTNAFSGQIHAGKTRTVLTRKAATSVFVWTDSSATLELAAEVLATEFLAVLMRPAKWTATRPLAFAITGTLSIRTMSLPAAKTLTSVRITGLPASAGRGRSAPTCRAVTTATARRASLEIRSDTVKT